MTVQRKWLVESVAPSSVSRGARGLAGFLAIRMDEKLVCWPAWKTLAIDMNATERSCMNWIGELKAAGLVSRVRHKGNRWYFQGHAVNADDSARRRQCDTLPLDVDDTAAVNVDDTAAVNVRAPRRDIGRTKRREEGKAVPDTREEMLSNVHSPRPVNYRPPLPRNPPLHTRTEPIPRAERLDFWELIKTARHQDRAFTMSKVLSEYSVFWFSKSELLLALSAVGLKPQFRASDFNAALQTIAEGRNPLAPPPSKWADTSVAPRLPDFTGQGQRARAARLALEALRGDE